MTRWGKPTKNKRRGNPKYRLDESSLDDWGDRLSKAQAPRYTDNAEEFEKNLEDGNTSQHGKPSKRPLESNENDRASGLAMAYLERVRAEIGHGTRAGSDPDPSLLAVEELLGSLNREHVVMPKMLMAFLNSPELDKTGLKGEFMSWAGMYHGTEQPAGDFWESKQPTTKTLMEGFSRFLNESYAMGSDPRHPNPGRPNTDKLNVAELGPQMWIEAVLNEPFTSTSMGSGGGMKGSDNTTTLADMFRDGHISDINDMQRHLEEIMYEDGMPDEEIQSILAHLKSAMYENGLV